MKPINNWDEVQASTDEFKKLPPGGYICAILSAEDVPEKEYIKIVYDIAAGEYADYYSDDWGKDNLWAHTIYRSYKESAAGMFKAFINAIEESNKGYKWNFDEKTLKGKLIGIVLGEEEYIGNDGSVKTRLKDRSTKSVRDIEENRFRIPKIKKLEEEQGAGSSVPAGFVESDDLPFLK